MKEASLVTREYRTIDYVSGPLVFVENVKGASYGEMVKIRLRSGEERTGQVLDISEEHAVIQVFEGTRGIDTEATTVRFMGEPARINVSLDMLGRVFTGVGKARDGRPEIIPESVLDIAGMPINPSARDKPADFIQTGMSAIDGLDTLVRGQKLPIFSGAGLPASKLAAQIARQAKVLGEGEQFAVVFVAMGITHKEASFFTRDFERTGALDRVVFFMNLADDPTVERLAAPRCGLAVAEYLAFTHNLHVLVILTDMINYCEALREISTAREEVPGRRGYPGYMYTDLSTIYERAGRLKGRKGSITQIPILTMPDDDITHPVPDLTGYITEGQIVLSRDLFRRGADPPVDALPCLSRLMNLGIGPGKTREDHRGVADQLYASYAYGRDLRRLVAIVGEEALTDLDKKYLKFADRFEKEFITQGDEDRSIERTLGIAWDLFTLLPEDELKRIKREHIAKYHPAHAKPAEKQTMEQVKPTRMELMKKKAQIRLAEQGRDLLREKMDALIQEFFKILSTVSDSRDELELVSQAADQALLIAQATDDLVTLKSAGLATRRSITVDISGKNIMGVPVPVIEKKRVSKSMLERGYGIISTTARIDETAERYEAEIDLLIKLAETETAMRRLGSEIQMNRRRVNALEQIMIPELKAQAKFIKNAIEEREREDLFRLKKVKSILERKKKLAKEKKVAARK